MLDTYGLLNSGAALGRGCGPLIVARPGVDLGALVNKPVAVPGLWTTAAMLLGLYAPQPVHRVPMSFEKIMPSLQNGELEIGVIIHEGRFTYQDHGLICLLDLGEWWEATTGGGRSPSDVSPSGGFRDAGGGLKTRFRKVCGMDLPTGRTPCPTSPHMPRKWRLK